MSFCMMSRHVTKRTSPGAAPLLRLLLGGALLLALPQAHALKSDRQQPLDIRADASDGTLGDGMATLRGNVEIRQGTLLIRSDLARVERVEGRVRRFQLDGAPVHLQQEIEEEGLVRAEARKVEYEVATGIVTLTGDADVEHPQYHISGEVLRYDMNEQHFQGSGGEADGRIKIRMDPEVMQEKTSPPATPTESPAETPGDPSSSESGESG
jgi:lipopolysaccharide export system protein LptA